MVVSVALPQAGQSMIVWVLRGLLCVTESLPSRTKTAFLSRSAHLYLGVSQGSTRQEALDNIKEAISGYLESLKKHNEPIPPPIWEDTVDINL